MSRGLGRAVCGGQLTLFVEAEIGPRHPLLSARSLSRRPEHMWRHCPCSACGFATYPEGGEKEGEYYMVRDEIWAAAKMSSTPQWQFLCIGCLERRIGRRLTRADFSDAGVNNLTNDYFRRTTRLIDRLSSPPTEGMEEAK